MRARVGITDEAGSSTISSAWPQRNPCTGLARKIIGTSPSVSPPSPLHTLHTRTTSKKVAVAAHHPGFTPYPSFPFRQDLCILSFFLSERTPLKHCCVHNMSPFVSSSGLSRGSRVAKVQRAKVCLNCMEPSVARSSCWSLPIGRYLSDTHWQGLNGGPCEVNCEQYGRRAADVY